MIITVKEAAEFLRISERYAYKLIKDNKLPHFRLGKKILIEKNSLIKYLHDIESKEA
ncbi:helix-turn-helix domain-containing protein [Staphylococcus hominis]|uniref:helix-turn-helix domain-containing protein n=1 Tax=Staphylococcus hominis TaxID=1290 RepID=UPI0012DED6D3|nr:helix-turn-helix domain-containing protein [Staphylococcus hominis]MDS0980153.1 helix-turn-helix domain-containing protein [Staphylococcus hominis]MDT4035235.1 helix-turn-helix domain-containing protein [Staphylococcus hominis]QGR79196.1 helix-turn-helix domain-containing protein [Staphylococcus hominis]UJB23928.1 helix-turn-helix domain-containing protein [Staphylococcus hominis]